MTLVIYPKKKSHSDNRIFGPNKGPSSGHNHIYIKQSLMIKWLLQGMLQWFKYIAIRHVNYKILK